MEIKIITPELNIIARIQLKIIIILNMYLQCYKYQLKRYTLSLTVSCVYK